eukprot:3347027-Pyramimonas_sp.AAC.1
MGSPSRGWSSRRSRRWTRPTRAAASAQRLRLGNALEDAHEQLAALRALRPGWIAEELQPQIPCFVTPLSD